METDAGKRVDEMDEKELTTFLIAQGIDEAEATAIQDKHHLNGEAFIDLFDKEVAELTESIGLRLRLLSLVQDAREKEIEYFKDRAAGKGRRHKPKDPGLKSRMTSLQSLVNATAFPQNLAMLVATIDDGDAKEFYLVTLVLLLLAMSLQVILAGMTVLLPSTGSPVWEDPETGKRYYAVLIQRFVIVLLLMVNVAADAFFIARGGVINTGDVASSNSNSNSNSNSSL